MANTLPILTKGGQTSGEVTLPDGLFGVTPNEHVMHEAVRTYLANQRSGTAYAKGRSDVSGGGKKPWRQKGTGRARVGSTRVSHWVGGGLAFGPQPRDFSMRLPKKIRRLALTSALSVKAAADEIKILEDFTLPKASTKEMASLLGAIGVGGEKVLLVIREGSRELFLSARNIENLKVSLARELTPYYLLWADKVILTKSALETVEEVFG
jgi:large subunit ribosomal protein L4